MFLHLWTE